MTTRPSNDAIAQAFWELRENAALFCKSMVSADMVLCRAREIDAAAPTPPKAEAWAWAYEERYGNDYGAWIERIARALPCWEYRNAQPLYTAQPAPPTDVIRDAERYRWLRKITPYRFRKLQEASIADTGDTLYFLGGKFDSFVDAAIREQQRGEKDNEQQRAPSKSQAKRIAAQKGESDEPLA